MNARPSWITSLGMLLMLLVVGCKTTQPDLKPPKQPEVFNTPSDTANLTSYPKQAFATSTDPTVTVGGLPPQRGMQGTSMQPASFGGPGSSSMGGMR